MASTTRINAGRILGGLVLLGIVLLLAKPGVLHNSRLFIGWFAFDARLKLSLDPDASSPGYYPATAKGPVSLASVVRDFRTAWKDQGVEVIHGTACEVATALLHHRDVEVGNLEGNRFVAWQMTPWAAADRISTEVMAVNDFLADDGRYIFRRK